MTTETITEDEIYRMAHHGALNILGIEHDRLEQLPNNEIRKAREARAWERLLAIEEAARAKGFTI